MRDTDLFQLALGLTAPWYVASCEFDVGKHRLDIEIDFSRGSVFACACCGSCGCSAHDTDHHSWRHLNFFQHEAYLTARVPRVLGAAGFATRDAVNGAEALCKWPRNGNRRWFSWIWPCRLWTVTKPHAKTKASPDIKDTAIIAVTASAFEEDKERILAAGADGYLAKPFKDAELFEIIDRLTGVEYLYEETVGGAKASEIVDDKALMRKTVAHDRPRHALSAVGCYRLS